jgi:hypothetical protein
MPKQIEVTGSRTLSDALGGSIEDRMKAPRTMSMRIEADGRIAVDFGGFWNGKLLHGALNAVSKAYRMRRYKNVRPNPSVPNKGVEDGDKKAKG